MSEEYGKFLNWCEAKWAYDYKMRKILSKLSNDDIGFLQEQYETRLKADMAAMLEDLDLRLEEMENPFLARVSGSSKYGWEHGVKNSRFVIQQKINALRGTNE